VSKTTDPAPIAAAVQAVAEALPPSVAGPALAHRLEEAARTATPKAAADIAQLLTRLGFVTQSESLYRALASALPDRPVGPVGLAQAALQRKAWTRALERWDAVLADFPKQRNGYWLAARARALDELGRSDEAVSVLEAASREFPGQPFADAGIAQLAIRRRCWSEALERWEALLARLPEHDSVPHSRTARARVLGELGRTAEAEAALRAIILADPWQVAAVGELARVLANSQETDAALDVLGSGVLKDTALPALLPRNMDTLLQSWRFDAARRLFRRHLEAAAGPEAIAALFPVVPQLFDGWDRTRTWIELSARLDRMPTPPEPEDEVPVKVLGARIRLALRDRAGFLAALGPVGDSAHLGPLAGQLKAAAAAIAGPRFPDHLAPKVLGIGLSKTGTTSLATALETLGLSTLHWTNPLTGEFISDDDFFLFEALTDTPVCLAFERHYHAFPAAKFVYTTRPIEAWLTSMNRHIRRDKVARLVEFDALKAAGGSRDLFLFGTDQQSTFRTLYLTAIDFRDAFERYDRRVRRFFADKPRDRFLEFNVFAGDGWPELCAFLGKDVPFVPFPFENRARALAGEP